MFSPAKLLGLIALLWGVWLLFRILERRQIKAQDTPPKKRNENPVELTECPECQKFVSDKGCARENCPVRG